jgi:triphosphoribosyl-dephospho-CoA synthase
MSTSPSELSQKLSNVYKAACMAELEAIKPGNVHMFADGHRMTIHDFIKSADASSTVIAQPNLSVGERIYQSIQATQIAVGMNTNLGIILLCAPLIHAALNVSKTVGLSFQQHLDRVLSQLTVEDAVLTAQAIVLANPAGLGDVSENDVNETPKVTLLNLMVSAQHNDYIAWQYANNFSDIFEFGLVKYAQAINRWQKLSNNRRQNQAWATTALYLSFLTKQLDSHVVRKHGEALAKQLMDEALEIEALFWEENNPKLAQKKLLAWDASLKDRNINPGTSADLTVACLMMSNLDGIV